MVEPIREHTYSLAAYLDAAKEEDIREDQDVQRLSGQWDASMINELVYTVLTKDYILPIILGEEDLEGGTTQLWMVDGVQRTSSLMMFRYGNIKITSTMTESHKVIEYQVRCMDGKGHYVKDEEGNFIYEARTFSLVNKTFDMLPKELQKEFDKFQIKTVIHQHCTMEKISELVRRYNNHKPMNAAQTAFTYVDKYARRIRNIAEHKFFTECEGFSEKEKKNGVYERVICETVMTMFHIDDWQKQAKKMGIYLNDNASDNEFDEMSNLLDRALDLDLMNFKQLFNTKDTFIWLGLFHRFNKLNVSGDRFVDFIEAFINELHNKEINDTTFNAVNGNRATKDKKIVKQKMEVLEALMMDFFNNSYDITDDSMTPVQFISDCTGLDIVKIQEDFDFYDELLNDLEDRTIKVGSKLLDPDNRLSLLAIVAYSLEHDIDLEEWLEDYAKANGYIKDQKENYLHMIQSLSKYIVKNTAA